VNFHFARAGNNTAEDVPIDMAPHEKQVLDLSVLFGRLPGEVGYRSILEITGEHEIDGYYSFTPKNGRDQAIYPLLDADDFKNEVVMPHYAGTEGLWWTNTGVFNPNDEAVVVWMAPYDHGGARMDDMATSFTLEAGEYEIFTVRSKFASVSDIAFIKFCSGSTGEGLPIGGLYLYGYKNTNSDGVWRANTLFGANM